MYFLSNIIMCSICSQKNLKVRASPNDWLIKDLISHSFLFNPRVLNRRSSSHHPSPCGAYIIRLTPTPCRHPRNLRVPPTDAIPGETIHLPNVGSMLGQRRRRWPSIDTTLGERIVIAAITLAICHSPSWRGAVIYGPRSAITIYYD